MSPVSHGLQESGKGRAHTARMWEAAWLKMLALLVLGLIVLAVLRQVSERAGLLDQLGHFLLPNCLQIIHLVLKLFQALGAEFIFLCHDSLHTFQTALRGGPGADDRSRI